MTMDFEWKTANFLKIWFSDSNGNGVHTFCIHRSCYYMTMILNGKLKIFENWFSYRNNGVTLTIYRCSTPLSYHDMILTSKTESFLKIFVIIPQRDQVDHLLSSKLISRVGHHD